MAQIERSGQDTHAGHSDLMDGVYRWQRHVYDVSRKYYLLGRDQLIERLAPGDGQVVLEVGCGTGRNLIKAARRYPKANFCGVDISENMLITARANVARAGLADRIELLQGDAATFSARQAFGAEMDRVFFSYALSMIPMWEKSLERGLENLSPAGSLHMVDFGQQERLPGGLRTVLTWWLAQFHVAARPDLAIVMNGLAGQAGRRSEVTPLYRGYTWLGRIA